MPESVPAVSSRISRVARGNHASQAAHTWTCRELRLHGEDLDPPLATRGLLPASPACAPARAHFSPKHHCKQNVKRSCGNHIWRHHLHQQQQQQQQQAQQQPADQATTSAGPLHTCRQTGLTSRCLFRASASASSWPICSPRSSHSAFTSNTQVANSLGALRSVEATVCAFNGSLHNKDEAHYPQGMHHMTANAKLASCTASRYSQRRSGRDISWLGSGCGCCPAEVKIF